METPPILGFKYAKSPKMKEISSNTQPAPYITHAAKNACTSLSEAGANGSLASAPYLSHCWVPLLSSLQYQNKPMYTSCTTRSRLIRTEDTVAQLGNTKLTISAPDTTKMNSSQRDDTKEIPLIDTGSWRNFWLAGPSILSMLPLDDILSRTSARTIAVSSLSSIVFSINKWVGQLLLWLKPTTTRWRHHIRYCTWRHGTDDLLAIPSISIIRLLNTGKGIACIPDQYVMYTKTGTKTTLYS